MQKTKIKIIVFLIVVVALISLVAKNSDLKPVFCGEIKKQLPVYSVDRADKKIAITFDCAWGDEYTEGILAEIKKFNVKCTFFAVSFWVEKYPEHVKNLSESGVEIGTHSKTHSHMSKLKKEEIEEELIYSAKAIENITGKKVTLFRAPFGEYTDTLLSVAKSLDMTTIQWDVDSLDWKDLSAAEIAARVIKKTASGSIILCHNNGKNTLKALPIIFSDLLDKGYEFVTVSELLLEGETFIDSSGKQKAAL